MMNTNLEHDNTERGNITLQMIILVVAFILIVGLVVDGAGKIQAGDRANQIAQSAARVAANSITGDAVANGQVVLDSVIAQNAAQNYINAAGVEGTVTVVGDTVTVTVTVEYSPIILTAFTLTGQGTASARLIDG